jgi:hypothetical protein
MRRGSPPTSRSRTPSAFFCGQIIISCVSCLAMACRSKAWASNQGTGGGSRPTGGPSGGGSRTAIGCFAAPLRDSGSTTSSPNTAACPLFSGCDAKASLVAQRGTHCQSPAMTNGRCRMHGGASLGAPKGNSHAFGRLRNASTTANACLQCAGDQLPLRTASTTSRIALITS